MRSSATSIAAVIIATALLLLALASTSAPYRSLREATWDALLASTSSPNLGEDPAGKRVVVVDIDRASLMAHGAWPWPRARLANLIEATAAAGPKAIALDVLLEGADTRSPAALARRLVEDVPALSSSLDATALEDGDALLTRALGKAPVILGIALDSDQAGQPLPTAPAFMRGKPDLTGLWSAHGVVGPDAGLAEAATGLGIVALPGDDDGRIRHAPLIVRAGNRLRAGIAIEAVRVASEASAYLVADSPQTIAAGDAKLHLPPEGMLRLRPKSEAHRATRTVSSLDLLSGKIPSAALEGRIVIIGSSAPETGGLRTAAFGRLASSAQLHADAAEQVLAGDAPYRPRGARLAELLLMLFAGAMAAYAGFRLSPYTGGSAVAVAALVWLGLCAALVAGASLLVDPWLPTSAMLIAQPVAAFAAATDLRRREESIRRRFEQHLAPEVVKRLVAEPGLLRLAGESREVTALFTDIEGFTEMAERLKPDQLVALLDNYFEGATQIVVEHGGMVERFVGDALHVLFNAPLDLADHPRKAVACAVALVEFTQRFREDTEARAAGFGRTRIGIETGMVILGDVGGGRRLDYTAHGRVMNLAARLEAANKELASSICVGPNTAARLEQGALRTLGRMPLKGFAELVEVGEPWPTAYDMDAKQAFERAMALRDTSPVEARRELQSLLQRQRSDAVLQRLIDRLPVSSPSDG